jgi:hypothetical protein
MAFNQYVNDRSASLDQATKNICKKLGELSKTEFCAVKALSTRCVYGKEIRTDTVSRIDSYGRENKIDLTDIRNGDTIRLGATVTNILGGPEKTGMLTIKDIKDVQFDPRTGELIIEGSDYCLVNLDCRRDIQILDAVISDPNNWVTKGELVNMTQNLTLSDYQFSMNLMRNEKEISRNNGLDSLISKQSPSGFDDWGMDDVFGSPVSAHAKEIDGPTLPDLLF